MTYANELGQAVDQIYSVREILKSVADQLWDDAGQYVREVPDSELVRELIASLRDLREQAQDIEAAQ